jgi:lysozyme
MDEIALKKWIKQDEGLYLFPYMDITGHVTIGYGRNLDNGIRTDEAELMFENDFNQSVKELEQYSWYLNQPQNVKNALININFNLGIHKLLEFHDMIHALIDKDYKKAAQAALNSLWAKQVPNRAKEITDMMME